MTSESTGVTETQIRPSSRRARGAASTLSVPQIILQTKDFCVVDKPHAWLSVPSRHAAEDIRPCLGLWLQKHLARQVWPVHRLDFEVSGIVLFALNAEAHREASKAFEGREVLKTYEAWSLPSPTKLEQGDPQHWECLLAKGKKRAFEAPWGKPAETTAIWSSVITQTAHSEISRAPTPIWVWHLSPRTGRSHQLRYEMARHQTPILGDVLYGGTPVLSSQTIALRATTLRLPAALIAKWSLPPQIEVADILTTGSIKI